MKEEIELTDEQIVRLVQDGDGEKFGILMERFDAKLSRYGRKFLSNSDNIKDIVQDVFIKTFENIQSFDTSLKFSSWIYRIAHNAFVNSLKKNSRQSTVFDVDILLSHHVEEEKTIGEDEWKKLKIMMDVGLDKLPPKYKEVIVLHYFEELGYREISDVLHIPVGTVGVRIKRGKEALRKIYDKMELKKHYE